MSTQKRHQALLDQQAGLNQTVDTAWNNLRPGIISVLEHKAMNKKKYLELYNMVYQYCTSCSAVCATDSYRQRELKSMEFLGLQLYTHLQNLLKDFLKAKSKEGESKIGPNVLEFYSNNWEFFTFSSNVIHNIFLYLNRHWVRREMEDGVKTVYEIYSLSLLSWREHFLGTLKETVTNAFLKLIEDDRKGIAVKSKLIQCIVKSYVDLGVENTASSRGRILSFYRENFEKLFLEQTKEFYQKESSDFLSKNTITQYVTKADTRLAEEKNRAERLLHESTMLQLISDCEQILIAQYLPQFYEELQSLLDKHEVEDIGRMYRLVSRVKESCEPMKNILEEHIRNQGESAIKAIKDRAQSEPQTYARELLLILNKYKGLVMTAFGNDSLFVQARDSACMKFININVVTAEKNTKNKTSELLARYSDLLLKKSSKIVEEGELEDQLQDVVTLLQYTEAKDAFKTFYSTLLAKRLINDLSTSDDAERSMITKLKEAFSSTFTEKLERMFTDIEVCRGLNEQFKSHLTSSDQKLTIDFGVQVVTCGHWPFFQSPSVALPMELDICRQKFDTFYTGQQSGRKLLWNYALSSGEIIGNFRRKYTFTVSTYQMLVLMRFNYNTSCTFQDICDNTQIEEMTLQQVIRALLKLKLLFGEGLPHNETEKIPATASLNLFLDYNNKKVRININMPLRTDAKREEDQTISAIEDERRFKIDAAVVRVMKMRKTLKHSELIHEVICLLKAQFKPRPHDIKIRIEDLICRDYLKRAEDQKDTYHYVA